MRPGTLGSRIFVSIGVILILVLLAGGIYGQSRIRAFHRAELERRLDIAAALLEERSGRALRGEISGVELQTWASGLRVTGFLRVTVIAIDGTVLADSDARLPVPSHEDRPEVIAALAAGRGVDERQSATTGDPTLYLARRVPRTGPPLGVIRVGAPLLGAEQEVEALRTALMLGGIVSLCIGLAVSVVVSRRLARPLEEIGRSAVAVAEGTASEPILVDGPEEVRGLGGALNRMAEKLRGRAEAERRARVQLETVLAGMVEGVVAVDGQERILFMNIAAGHHLGLEQPVPRGGTLWERVRFPALERSLREALSGGAPARHDAPVPGDDGRILEISAAPLGSGEGAVALLRDVTEVRRLEQVRMDFVANVSHELRTPLAGVLGALETIADPELDPPTRARFLDIALRNASRLQALVRDLLDLSAIEVEQDRMTMEPTDPRILMGVVVAAWSGEAVRRGVTLRLEEREGDRGLRVLAHGGRLEQALVNVVENAVKYTPRGGSVVVRIEKRGEWLALEVEDTGIGIPSAVLPRVFERFFRVDPSRSREMGGTGLGLAIVKHVVRAHRGKVELKSREGQGTRFTILLRLIQEGDGTGDGA
jgi:two-component system phosphate regulon sensor histidine kinase PhoR